MSKLAIVLIFIPLLISSMVMAVDLTVSIINSHKKKKRIRSINDIDLDAVKKVKKLGFCQYIAIVECMGEEKIQKIDYQAYNYILNQEKENDDAKNI